MAPKNTHYKVVILGSGPAGLTAAIYAARADLAPLVMEGAEPGGQLMLTSDVENFPGFPTGVMGPELMAGLREQAERVGAKLIYGVCETADLSSTPIVLGLDEGQVTCDSLVIATGASARWLGLPSETEYLGRGVTACAVCDGAFFRDVPVAVIGGGDSAMEEAHFLTKFASKVYIIHRREELRASKIMAQRAKDHPKIEFVLNKKVLEVQGNDKDVTGILVKDIKTGEESVVEVQAMFLAIGHIPNTTIFKGQLDLDGNGYIVTKPDCSETNLAGVFAAGDVQDTVYKQAITAAGSGCEAALDAERYLESLHA